VRRAVAALTALVLLAGALAPAGALADGDPASDTILNLPAFLPFTPPVSAAVGRRLGATIAAAGRRGKPLKVAVIASAPDLGSVSSLFGRPQQYAEFLSREDAFAVKVPILVVMPAGLGFAKKGIAQDLGAAKDAKIPSGATSDQLATVATEAVAKLAGIKAASGGGGGGSGTSGFVVAAIVIVGLTIAGVGGALLLRGRRDT
jgi:hypothetical protein